MPDHLSSSNEKIYMISLTHSNTYIHTRTTLLSFSCFIVSSVSPLSDYMDFSILLICHFISIFCAKEYVILSARTVPQPLNPLPNLLLIFQVSDEMSLSPKAFADQPPLPTPHPRTGQSRLGSSHSSVLSLRTFFFAKIYHNLWLVHLCLVLFLSAKTESTLSLYSGS